MNVRRTVLAIAALVATGAFFAFEALSQQASLTRGLEPTASSTYWVGTSSVPYLSIITRNASTTNLDVLSQLRVLGSPILFGTGSATSTLGTASGAFGIGTTTPGQVFSAQGTGLITGPLTVGLLVGTSTIQFKNLISCDTIDTDSSGVLSCGTDSTGGLTGGNANAITYWTSGTAVAATSSPTIQAIFASSTTRSSLAGGLDLGRPGLAIGTGTPGAMLSVNGDALIPVLAVGLLTSTSTITGKDGLTIVSGDVSVPAGSISNAELANSSLTVTAGAGLTGGGVILLGGSGTVDVAVDASLTAAADQLSINLGNSNTWTAAQIFNAGLGVGSSTPGNLLAAREALIGGLLTASQLRATSSLSVATTTPGAMLSVKGPFLTQSTSTIEGGGLLTQGIISTSTLGFYIGGTALPRIQIDASSIGIASSSPGWPLSIAATTTLSSQIASNIASTSANPDAQVIVDWSNGNTRRFIISQNTTLIFNATSSGPLDGGKYILKACQNHVGGFTLAVNSDTIREATTSAGASLSWVSTKPNTCTFIGMQYDADYGAGHGIYTFLATSTGLLSR